MEGRKTLWQKLKNIGPGAIVVAAFIGPGTVTTCTLAGVNYKFALLWAMLFSTIATIILQEMSARIGIVANKGLGSTIREAFEENPTVKVIVIALVIAALGIGNSAFQSGNISGASMGLQVILGGSKQLFVVLIALVASILLWTGSYKLIEKVLLAIVIMMSIVFIATAVIISPNWSEVIRGLFVPTIPQGALLVTLGLIGTTVVPYNLYLHSSAAVERWGGYKDKKEAISESRLDAIISIGLGGLISMAVIITSSSMFGTGVQIKSGADMARQLEPLLGPWAKWFFALGLFGAGISSAMTAPLAAAYAITGILGLKSDLKANYFRAIWLIVILIGATVAFIGANPVQVIVFAQAVNGILLPISAILLILVINNKKIMKDFVNTTVSNILGYFVVAVTVVLGLRMILVALKII
ncbi:MAG: manganese transport protein [Tepidanaerobacteraceae bacterium]|jgi:NRAMP (natural resistance-associated macrophage protein)-like metal ion transporter|uniref:NRAMP (Natural resistance-associated macrophage protein) metal ion transporters n=1 Tax=Caldanaerovirga acetigignens TaxID=447595 RepID=A0A1M7LY19_9FIRM|nr:Nramp family divalent metal transporter [Caldanaerovirga acetigignens]MDN5331524.1 manganese transport protein [Tepidanaerobacteraceae bacterium]SHM82726.1 NRAMP (natural resistance-associated macrophage protein) metal ion transporters [Caldanaerovirga acetigignens]